MSKTNEADYAKICLFCENASKLCGDDNMLCKKKGVIAEDHTCRKFVYDPLKRTPNTKPKIPKLSKEDII